MPPQQQADPGKDLENQERQQLNAKVGDQVLRTMGKPNDPHRLQVRRLWKDHYRVNILVGADVVSAKVAQSYFVVADDDGNIVTSTPEIIRKYRPAALAMEKGNVSGPPMTT